MYPSQPYLGRMSVCQGLYERKIKYVEFTTTIRHDHLFELSSHKKLK